MHALTLMLQRIHHGWAAVLTDGRELARLHELCAKRRALWTVPGLAETGSSALSGP